MKSMVKSVLSPVLYEKLKKFYKENITHYQRDIYSEFGEDFIAAVLLGFKRDGYYVDIGAFRPKELSVTYYFYKKLGWQGLVVEPNPAPKGEFLEQRPRDTFINFGVAKEVGKLTYYEFKDPTLNSFSINAFNTYKDQFVQKQEIEVMPLSKILDEHVPQDREIDLMNIDVEGLDLEVLASNDWETYRPKIITVEDHRFDPERPMESEIVSFLKAKGYRLKANALISLVFEADV